MKILFINLPCHGHVIPTIDLLQELFKAGHHVTYLMPYDWEGKITDSGADFLGYENNLMDVAELATFTVPVTALPGVPHCHWLSSLT